MKCRQTSIRRRRFRRNRGIIFVTALGIVVILTGLVLVYAQAMSSEAIASANIRSAAKSDAIELGAEQWVMAQCDAYTTDAMTVTSVPAEALQVGDGYFWIMQPDWQTDSDYQFGITDEMGKLNINYAGINLLQALPADLTSDIAQAIVDWRTNGGGASASYYESLPEPYESKGSANGKTSYESPEELLLVEGVTPQLLFGYDMNRNGVMEDAERTLSGGSSGLGSFGTNIDSRGIYNYITCFNTSSRKVNAVKVNVNTASEQVLIALGIQQNDADAIIQARQGQDYTDASWLGAVFPAAQNPNSPYGQIFGTGNGNGGKSSLYSADIVAASGDGRSFKRVRIVVDASVTPSRIIYRKDLTSYGWPLDPNIRETLREGKPVYAGSTPMTSSGTLGKSH